MQQKFNLLRLAPNFFKKRSDLGIIRNVAWKQWRLLSELADQFFDVLLQPFALVVKDQTRAGIRPGFRNRPRNAALVRHAENDARFAGQNLLLHTERQY